MGKKEMGKASTNASICETGWGILFIYWIVLKINQNLNQNVNKGTCRKTCVCLRWTNMPVHVLNNTLLKQFLMKLQNEVLDSDYFIDYNLTWISFAKLCIDIFSLFQFYFKRFRKTRHKFKCKYSWGPWIKISVYKIWYFCYIPYKLCKPWSNIRKALKIVPEKANI